MLWRDDDEVNAANLRSRRSALALERAPRALPSSCSRSSSVMSGSPLQWAESSSERFVHREQRGSSLCLASRQGIFDLQRAALGIQHRQEIHCTVLETDASNMRGPH